MQDDEDHNVHDFFWFLAAMVVMAVLLGSGHFMNVKMSMHSKDVHLVEGQLGPRDRGKARGRPCEGRAPCFGRISSDLMSS